MIYGRYNSYFTLIKKKKLHFSFICSFFCRLVKKSWALKFVEQFSIRGLVAYEPVAYKKSKCSFQMSYFHISYEIFIEKGSLGNIKTVDFYCCFYSFQNDTYKGIELIKLNFYVLSQFIIANASQELTHWGDKI